MTIKEKLKLRKEIEEKAKSVKGNGRIHIDKDLLEQLLFDNVDKVFDGCKAVVFNKPGKFITWSTPLLSKIDLSEVSFEDVIWRCCCYDWYENSNDIFTEQPEKVILSNTNAKIDFRKSFLFKNANHIAIEYCDFKGTDLSNNNLKDVNGIIIESDLSNTNIDIPLFSNGVLHMGPKIYVYTTDLSNNDLSKYTLDTSELEGFGRDYEGTIFNNTGVNFVSGKPINIRYLDEDAIKRVKGCYINGVPTNSYIKNQRIEELNDMKEDIEAKLKNEHIFFNDRTKLLKQLDKIDEKIRELEGETKFKL